MDYTLREIYSKERIDREVQRLAREISGDYEGKELLVLVILKGAFIFAADLLRKFTIPATVEFLEISSYCGMDSTGKVKMVRDARFSVQGRDVLLVEDIIDQGICLSALVQDLRQRNPASLKVCTLIDNRKRRTQPIEPDYAGIREVCGFLVGYGLDLDQRYRELPAVYEVVPTGNSDDVPQ
ncbi:MAG: hypoxanthine phosphoribosyltransferase [Deltaproteobacteria bacterium]|nr:hypoxanthine phosphoribosyltransferase [Deltaproteobacteria bacterium]TLN01147.1 MAG: hypoxanthine phosphoribosyltransferase [bacterium]